MLTLEDNLEYKFWIYVVMNYNFHRRTKKYIMKVQSNYNDKIY